MTATLTAPEMSNEQIAIRIKNGMDSYGELTLLLIQRNKGFITLKSRPFVSRGLIERDEVLSLAFLATDDAIRYWDIDKGAYLPVFALRLVHELLSAVNSSRNAPMPINASDLFNRFCRFKAEYTRRTGQEPDDSVILKTLRIKSTQLETLRQTERIQLAMRLDAVVETEDDTADSMIDLIEDPSAMPVDESAVNGCYQAALREAIEKSLASLPAEQAAAIRSKFFENGTADNRSVRKGLNTLMTEKRLASFLAYENEFSHTGETFFRNAGESSPERLICRYGIKPKPRSRKGERQ